MLTLISVTFPKENKLEVLTHGVTVYTNRRCCQYFPKITWKPFKLVKTCENKSLCKISQISAKTLPCY